MRHPSQKEVPLLRNRRTSNGYRLHIHFWLKAVRPAKDNHPLVTANSLSLLSLNFLPMPTAIISSTDPFQHRTTLQNLLGIVKDNTFNGVRLYSNGSNASFSDRSTIVQLTAPPVRQARILQIPICASIERKRPRAPNSLIKKKPRTLTKYYKQKTYV